MVTGHGEARRRDTEARRVATGEFRRPVVLEAGAGTGKTTTLVARVLSWCLGAGWERHAASDGSTGQEDPQRTAARVLDRVAAITFTEKAAAEMEQGVAEGLRAVLGEEEVLGLDLGETVPSAGERARRAGALLDMLHRLEVGTIHAFCRRLLADHPLEAGLAPGFEVDAEGLGLAAVVEEVVAETITAGLGAEPDEDLLVLSEKGKGPADLAAVLESLAASGVPGDALREDYFTPERVAAARSRLLELSEDLVTRLRAGAGALPANAGVSRLVAEFLVAVHDGSRGAQTVEELVAAVPRRSLPEALERMRKWIREGFNKGETQAFGTLTPELKDNLEALQNELKTLGELDPELLRSSLRLLAPMLDAVHRRMRHRGLQTFSALLQDAGRLLRERPQVCRRVRKGLDQLLVDEFQDTDPVQYTLVGALALEGPEEERPGLFLVGDPKQSIYGWRSADLGAYETFRKRVKEVGGAVLPLVVNFRSVPAILDEVTRAVAPVMVEEAGLQPPFEELVPSADHENATGFQEADARPVEYWVSWRRGEEDGAPDWVTTSEAARQVEARALAEDLLRVKGAGLDWRDFGVLMRATTAQEPYLQELRERGIPYVVESDRSYFRRREVIDAAALVRTVVDPNDQVALVGFLRSPVVGTPDAALLPLWRAGLPEKAARLRSPSRAVLQELDAIVAAASARVPEDVPGLERVPGWPVSLRYGLRSLALLREAFSTEPADVFVEMVRGLLLSEETEAARFLGSHRLANLDRFLRRLLEAFTTGEGGPHGVLRALRRGTAEAIEEPQGAPGDATQDAVRVMSIHKAKGLTFRHTYLVDLHHGSRNQGLSGDVVRSWEGRRELCILGCPSLGIARVAAHDLRVAEAERVRTLYVAMTRPKERLVLCGLWPEQDGTPRAGSHLALLDRRPEGRPDLEAACADTSPQDAVIVDHEDGTRWRVPDHATPPEAPPGSRRPAAPVSMNRARDDAQALAGARQTAQQRMQRPLTGTASGLEEWEPDPGDAEDSGALLVREVARAAGTAVHHVLEHMDLQAPASESLAEQRQGLPAFLEGSVAPELLSAVQQKAEELLERIRQGPLLERLRELAPAIVARELPLLLAATGRDAGLKGAVGAVIGTADLVYREPGDGRLVVADFKTDRVQGAADMQERVAAYTGQGLIYVEALAAALPDLPQPRFELWFLDAGTVVPVSLA